MSSQEHGQLVISLDFELYWGVRDHSLLEEYRGRLKATRKMIPRLLELFESYAVHATWATVGFLFADGREELREHLPMCRPSYECSKYSPYEHIEATGESERDDPYHFAPSLIEEISETSGQEVGSHTFSHYYCMEAGQHRNSWRADLTAASEIAAARGIEMDSLVFPRNQHCREYLKDCGKAGIQCYRGQPNVWMYRPRPRGRETHWRRGARLLDAHVPLSGTLTHELERRLPSGLWNVPASRFMRPWTPVSAPLAPLRLRRIHREMTGAARAKEVYHLWWHPHNFGRYPEQNFGFLRSVLDHFAELREAGDMVSTNMREAAETAERSLAAAE